jgi:26S proteasome regulatory subunit T1
MVAEKEKKTDEGEPGKDDDKPIKALTEEDVRIMQAYGAGPYSSKIKKLEAEVKDLAKKVNEIAGIKESDTGLAHPSRWDLVSDKQMMQEEQPLQVRPRIPTHGSLELPPPLDPAG